MQMMFIELPTSKIVFKNTMKPGNKAVNTLLKHYQKHKQYLKFPAHYKAHLQICK